MVVRGYGQEQAAKQGTAPNWSAWIILAFTGWLVGSVFREDVRSRK